MEQRVISFESGDIGLKGQVYIPYSPDLQPAPALCLCHGIPGGGPPDPSDPGYPTLARRFSQAGFLTVIFNFRGTGASEGNFDIAGWTKDLVAALDYLCNMSEVDRGRISIMGFSAGAAVSVRVASQDSRISSLITCACPAQFLFAADHHSAESTIAQFRHIGIIKDESFPPSVSNWMASFKKVKPIEWIDKISPRPLLIIHGTQDDVVDPMSARALYERAGEPKEIMLIEGAGHRLRLVEQAMDGAMNWLTARVSPLFRD